MTVCKVDSLTNGQLLLTSTNGNSLILKFDSKIWKVIYDTPSFEGMEYESFKDQWGGKQITRVIFQNKKPIAKGRYSFTFIPG